MTIVVKVSDLLTKQKRCQRKRDEKEKDEGWEQRCKGMKKNGKTGRRINKTYFSIEFSVRHPIYSERLSTLFGVYAGA